MCGGNPCLTRIVRQTAGLGGGLADSVEGSTTLDALDQPMCSRVGMPRNTESNHGRPEDGLQRRAQQHCLAGKRPGRCGMRILAIEARISRAARCSRWTSTLSRSAALVSSRSQGRRVPARQPCLMLFAWRCSIACLGWTPQKGRVDRTRRWRQRATGRAMMCAGFFVAAPAPAMLSSTSSDRTGGDVLRWEVNRARRRVPAGYRIRRSRSLTSSPARSSVIRRPTLCSRSRSVSASASTSSAARFARTRRFRHLYQGRLQRPGRAARKDYRD